MSSDLAGPSLAYMDPLDREERVREKEEGEPNEATS